ncbi:alpha/beta fold hydrolase [Lutimonas saemankumensis]|uniref:alpha/beta fold hydrolase n=1 Tax=Lutimonas saemankumensis TaxID=483016 RepID=UPI001CD382E3|nr:alpha/beta fold hydrolase [Lutimonas saemankumensis]MCA0932546.1 alpha/beta fold hydrolase [Lutimonas saemankumensis]
MPDILYKNLNVHYSDTGHGKALVFLHGFLENAAMWEKVTLPLKQNFRIICIDLLGHGKTQNLGYIHSMEDQAKLVIFVLSHLGIERFSLIGHSMGGYISLAISELIPKRVDRLCLMNSTALADTEEKKINRDRGIAAVKQNYKTFVRLAIPNLFSEENRTVFLGEIKEITDQALKMSAQGIIASLEGMKVRPDRTNIISKESLPVLMIIGKKDPALDYQSLLDQSRHKNVTAVIFDDGHMSHIENERDLTSAFSEWFSKKVS